MFGEEASGAEPNRPEHAGDHIHVGAQPPVAHAEKRPRRLHPSPAVQNRRRENLPQIRGDQHGGRHRENGGGTSGRSGIRRRIELQAGVAGIQPIGRQLLRLFGLAFHARV